MMIKHLALSLLLAGLSLADEVRISAASSLADALKDVNAAFAKATGHTAQLNLGASSLLARQIGEGAPADVFFSADAAQMDALAKKDLVDAATRADVLSNRLVIVVPTDGTVAVASLADLAAPGVKRIATGDPRAVPVGVYAKAALVKAGLWDALAPKIVATENVRAALAVVESGNVDAGLVYRTDAAISKRVKVAAEVPETAGAPVVYPVAVLRAARHRAGAEAWVRFVRGPEAKKLFEARGFSVLTEK